MASILIIYNEIPNERHNGGTIRVFYLLKELSRYHDITLLTIPTSRSEKPATGYLKFCREVILAPSFVEEFLRLSPLEFFRFIWNNFYYLCQLRFSSKPEMVRKHFLQVYCLKRELKNILKKKSFNYIQVEYAYLGEVLSGINGQYGKIIDFHEVYDWTSYLAPVYDIALSCSKKDVYRLKKMDFKKVLLVANGVDTKTTKPLTFSKEAKRLLFVGDLMYGPNKQAIRYFLHNIYPLLEKPIPLNIIGRYDQNDFKNELNMPGAKFHGFLPAIDSYFQNAVFICPILEGGGTRIKILTAFLKGAPVVSTAKGAEGIECTDGKDIIITNSAKQFAKEIGLLLNDVKRYNQVRNAGRDLVDKNYDWRKTILNYAKNL
ncbi:MAG: glycosyltransferase [Candidatus Levybacteria bacterium]|nr:glycosyltransferase [Candidatus Levybacteria bacterium]